MKQDKVDDNELVNLAREFVYFTNQHVFITGKAGTGKTTLLRQFKATCTKKMAIVSPTGVAAINAGGVTIHSFFQLPPGSFIPTMDNFWDASSSKFITHQGLLKNIKLSAIKKNILQELELLIIDEISMVRADMLDAIDIILRRVRNKNTIPFGGVQVVYFGDLYQLPPVVSDEEWNVLQNYYETPFFFSAQFVQDAPPLLIELNTIFRQSDTGFIEVLNNIRNNEVHTDDINFLNRRYDPYFHPSTDEPIIVLTTHNYKAEQINQKALQHLPNEEFLFEGQITDEFNDKALPVDQQLKLKLGSQVMFVRNDTGDDRRYYNGKIGIIKEISNDNISVQCEGDEEMIDLKREVWNNIRYVYNHEKDALEEEIIGSYSQYPIRLAWAITIHKSQGLTFEKAVIDSIQAFAPGQVYVALSRLTGLKGLILSTPIHEEAIKTDERIHKLKNQVLAPDNLYEFLATKKLEFIRNIIMETFSWYGTITKVNEFIFQKRPVLIDDENSTAHVLSTIQDKGTELIRIGNAFIQQLKGIFNSNETTVAQNQHALERLKAAIPYFTKEIQAITHSIDDVIIELKVLKRTKKKIRELQTLQQLFIHHFNKIARTEKLLHNYIENKSLLEAFQYIEWSPIKKEENKENTVDLGTTFEQTLRLYQQGMSVEMIAKNRDMAVSTIESHIAKLIIEEKIDIFEIIDEDIFTALVAIIQSNPGKKLGELKAIAGDIYSYFEIKITLAHLEKTDH